MAFNIEGKEMYSVFSQSVAGQSTPKWQGLQACSHQTEKNTPTQTLQFHVKFTCLPC